MPYTGEGVRGSHLAFDKILSKARFDEHGVPTWSMASDQLRRVSQVGFSVRSQGPASGFECWRAHRQGPFESPAALQDCFQPGPEVLVEEFFPGRELTVGILGDEALPVIEIVPREGFYDYEHKYTKGASQYFVPAEIGKEATQAVQDAALSAHQALGLEVYSRVDVLPRSAWRG